MFNHKEDIIYFFLKSKIRLSSHDHKFISNLLMLIGKNSYITSNQANLFEKLIKKYERQISKNGESIDNFVDLKWKSEIKESSILYTGASIFLEAEYVKIKTPFNKKFINALKSQNYFVWDNENKNYKALFRTKAIKYALEIVSEFFKDVRICDSLKLILNKIENYKNLIWNPTLKESNGFYYIANINETLFKLLKDVELNDNPYVLYQLSKMGIDIDDNIIKSDPFKKFASEFICHVDIDELRNVSSYLRDLNIDAVFATRSLIRLVHNIRHDIKNALNNISFFPVSEIGDRKNIVVLNYGISNFDIDLESYKKRIDKMILITNSRPINIK